MKTTSKKKAVVKRRKLRVTNPSKEVLAQVASQQKPLYLYSRFFAMRRHDVDAMIEMLELYGEAKRWRIEQNHEQAADKQATTSGRDLPALSAEDLVKAEIELEDKKACLDAQSKLLESSGELMQRMLKGDSSAAVALLRTAQDVTSVLQLQYRKAPELFADYLKFTDRLPVIATLYPGWVARAKESMKTVHLGTHRISSRLKRSAYKTNKYPCRAWAAWALEVLELNRANAVIWSEIFSFLQAGNRTDLNLMLPPTWAMKSWELQELSKQSLPEWALLAREMIRKQVPNFHTLPEFRTEIQRIKARARHRDDVAGGKPLTGTLQTALLDKIINAMRSIVV